MLLKDEGEGDKYRIYKTNMKNNNWSGLIIHKKSDDKDNELC